MADLYSLGLEIILTGELEDIAEAFSVVAETWEDADHARGLMTLFGDLARCFREEEACRIAGCDGGLRAMFVDLGADEDRALVRALQLVREQLEREIDDENAKAGMLRIVALPIREELLRRQVMAAVEAATTDTIPVEVQN